MAHTNAAGVVTRFVTNAAAGAVCRWTLAVLAEEGGYDELEVEDDDEGRYDELEVEDDEFKTLRSITITDWGVRPRPMGMVDLPLRPRIPINTRVEVRKLTSSRLEKGEAVAITASDLSIPKLYNERDRGIVMGVASQAEIEAEKARGAGASTGGPSSAGSEYYRVRVVREIPRSRDDLRLEPWNTVSFKEQIAIINSNNMRKATLVTGKVIALASKADHYQVSFGESFSLDSSAPRSCWHHSKHNLFDRCITI